MHNITIPKPQIFVTRPDFPIEGFQILESKCDVEMYENARPIPKEHLIIKIAGKHGLLCMATDPIDRDVIEAAGTQLKIIATMSEGYLHIDTATCQKYNITVCNTPCLLTEAVAEWAVLLMTAAGRHFFEAAKFIAEGLWIDPFRPSGFGGNGLNDAVVGIVGMGEIGMAILKRVLAFNVKRVLYYNSVHPVTPAKKLGAVYADFQHLLATSDYIISIIGLNEETRKIFNKRSFGIMKPSAIFINIGRGGVVDQDDLYEVLKDKRIRAAALDVVTPEPMDKDNPLLTLDNIIITPHVGTAVYSARIKMAELAAKNIVNVVFGEKPLSPVYIQQNRCGQCAKCFSCVHKTK